MLSDGDCKAVQALGWLLLVLSITAIRVAVRRWSRVYYTQNYEAKRGIQVDKPQSVIYGHGNVQGQGLVDHVVIEVVIYVTKWLDAAG